MITKGPFLNLFQHWLILGREGSREDCSLQDCRGQGEQKKYFDLKNKYLEMLQSFTLVYYWISSSPNQCIFRISFFLITNNQTCT